MSAQVEITGIDNRGDEAVPFGYVYFSDDVRVGFGDTRGGIGDHGLFGGNWGVPTERHYTLAEEALTERFGKTA